jgi:transcriptional regulator with XRE-family HTH domain
VDDEPYTKDLDLASVTTHDELTARLQTVHLRADSPSLRELEARTRHRGTPLSKTVVGEMLKGTRFPRKTVMVAFLRVCGVRDESMAPWLRAWERVAVSDSPQGPAPEFERLREQISQLNADNDRLRRQVAVIGLPRPQAEPHATEPRGSRAAHSPIASRRELGALLRGLRKEKGLKVEEVAAYLMCSVNKVRGMEASFRAGMPRDVRDLCQFYGVTDEAERGQMIKLAEDSKQKGWWQSYALDYATYVGLEAEAVAISAFQSSAVHGLLHTADYARAGHERAMPRLSPDRIEMQIEAKLTRQRILTQDNSPRLTVILDEAVLHRMCGGRRVMAEQLAKIAKMSARSNIEVQVLSYEVGAHPAMESNFTILELPDQAPDIVFVEGLIGSTYLERPEDLKRYREIFDRLRAMALNPTDSAALVAGLGRSYLETAPDLAQTLVR